MVIFFFLMFSGSILGALIIGMVVSVFSMIFLNNNGL
jgi:hypothetical protein